MRLSIKVENGLEKDYGKLTVDQRDKVKHLASVKLSQIIVEVRGSR